MAERRRNRIRNETRHRLVQAFKDPAEDYLHVANTLGIIHRSTARGIVGTYVRESRVEERPRGGRNNTKDDDEVRACLNEIVNENCLVTLNQFNQELRSRQAAKPQVYDRTIARALDGMLIRCKIARPLPAERNRSDVIEKLVEYANWLLVYGQRSSQPLCLY